MSTFYQATPVGIALMHALETMLQEKLISETQARKIIAIFDEVMKGEISTTVVKEQALTAIIEGVIENYNCVEDCWRIDASDVQILIGTNLILVPKARFLFAP